MNILRGMKILWIFLGSSQNWTSFRAYFVVSRVFFKVNNIQTQDIFCKNFKYFLGA